MKTLLVSILILTSLSAKDVVVDTTTKLLWQDSSDNKDLAVTYKQAQDYCAKLIISEYHDFRIPTLSELQTIIDYKNYKPAILNGFNYAPSETFWTSTPFANDKEYVWSINFKKGDRSTRGKHYDRHIRCVQDIK